MFQVNYTENGGSLNVIDLFPEEYNSGSFLVDFRLPANPGSTYKISIAGYNVRGIGAIFNLPDNTPPLDCKRAAL